MNVSVSVSAVGVGGGVEGVGRGTGPGVFPRPPLCVAGTSLRYGDNVASFRIVRGNVGG